MANIEEVQQVWKEYCATISDWQQLVVGIEPKQSGCGPIYEFTANPIEGRPNEDFCIADMRDLAVTEPHYHPEGVYEVYIVLTGLGRVFVGQEEHQVGPGDVVVMTPHTAHFTIPEENLVLGVVNTPPFNPEEYIPVQETDESVGFSKELFDRLTAAA